MLFGNYRLLLNKINFSKINPDDIKQVRNLKFFSCNASEKKLKIGE